jgi:hypothetical protein
MGRISDFKTVNSEGEIEVFGLSLYDVQRRLRAGRLLHLIANAWSVLPVAKVF